MEEDKIEELAIFIDTREKVIQLDSDVNAGELFGFLEKALPNGEWAKYTIETPLPDIFEDVPIIIPSPDSPEEFMNPQKGEA